MVYVTIYDSGGVAGLSRTVKLYEMVMVCTSPSYTFNNDVNTGFYRRTDDQIGVSMIGSLCFGLVIHLGQMLGPGIMNEGL